MVFQADRTQGRLGDWGCWSHCGYEEIQVYRRSPRTSLSAKLTLTSDVESLVLPLGVSLNLVRMIEADMGQDVATVATDIALTVLMLIGLRKTKTGWSSTDALVSRLIR